MPANRFEILAAWYLRFNGYFTTANFTVHPNSKKEPGGTDADILAVRFPHSEEQPGRFLFERDALLINQGRIDFLICEVKKGLCDINQNSWSNPDRENVEYALKWMGFEQEVGRIEQIAKDIYTNGAWNDPDSPRSVRFISFGSRRNPKLKERLPLLQEILHLHVIDYLKTRFNTGCCQIKRENWENEIVTFAELCTDQSSANLLHWANS